jgi:hypothetical protein
MIPSFHEMFLPNFSWRILILHDSPGNKPRQRPHFACVDGCRQCKENPALIPQENFMFNPTRDQARQFLFDTWRKRRAGELLTPLEDLTAQLIEKHPEYHELFSAPEQNQGKDYAPDGNVVNPFLHVMMHLSIEEQISIGQPHGIREQFARLTQKYESEHEAQHAMMDCLGEMIWQAQRNQTAPDPAIYIGCLEKQ